MDDRPGRPAWRPDGPRKTPAGFWVPPGASLPALRGAHGLLEVGAGAQVGHVTHGGSVVLGPRVQAGDVEAGPELIVGAGCRTGNILCAGRVVVQHGAVVGRITSGADVLLLGDCVAGDVVAAGDIIVEGGPKTGSLKPGGRVVVR